MIENNNYGALNNEQEPNSKIPSSNSTGSRQRFDIAEPNYNSTGCEIQKYKKVAVKVSFKLFVFIFLSKKSKVSLGLESSFLS